MARAWQLLVKARGDTNSAQRAMRDLSRSTRALSQAIGIDFRAIAKVGAFALGAGLAASVKIGVDELRESAVVSAQTAAALKSTGGAAGVTQKQIEGLASAISLKTGIDDEAIQSGQNLLLTFTNLKNGAGKGNDIFNQTTRIMTDMSVALGQDTKTSAIQLGKALNDPIRGVGALRKVGVSFTEAQKKQIEKLVESGNVMGAQKIILAELNKEFGGSAEAFGKTGPGAVEKAKNAFAELSATILQAVAPSFGKLMQKLALAIGRMQKWTKTAEGQRVLDKVRRWVDDLGRALATTGRFLADVTRWAIKHREALLPVAVALGTMVATYKAWKIATAAMAVAQAALNVVLLGNPVGLVVLAVAGLVAGFVTLYKRNEEFRKAVNSAWPKIKKAMKEVADVVVAFTKKHWPAMKKAAQVWFDYGTKAWKLIFKVMGPVIDAVKWWATVIAPKMMAAWGPVFAFLRKGWEAAGVYIGAVKTTLGWYQTGGAAAVDAVKGSVNTLTTAWGGVKNAIEWLRDFGNAVLVTLDTKLTNAKDAALSVGVSIGGSIKSGIAWLRDSGNAVIVRLDAVLTAAKGAALAVAAVIGGGLKRWIGWIRDNGNAVWSTMSTRLQNAGAKALRLATFVGTNIANGVRWLGRNAGLVFAGMGSRISGAATWASTLATRIGTNIVNGLVWLGSYAAGKLEPLRSYLSKAAGWAQALKDAIATAIDKVESLARKIANLPSLPNIPGLREADSKAVVGGKGGVVQHNTFYLASTNEPIDAFMRRVAWQAKTSMGGV